MDSLTLSDLLKDVPDAVADGVGPVVSGVAYRSDRVRPGDVFFAIPGTVSDGNDFAGDAVSRGAVAVVTSRRLAGLDVWQAVVPDVRTALARASARFFGMPTERLDVVGITGTNGKTTTAYLVEAIARAAGRTTGLIGTVETRIAGRVEPAGRTTPESRDLQELFSRMASEGVDTVAMEVSSHAIQLCRVEGVAFAVTAFTNLSQDHLDFHGSMDAYLRVKARLLSEFPSAARVVNVDDAAGAILASTNAVEWTVGRDAAAAVRAEDLRLGPLSSEFTLRTPTGSAAVTIPLVGDFNVSNALVAAGCALALGIDVATIAAGLARAPQVPGRLERIDEGQPFAVLVDYAHTPDGLAKAITAVREITAGRIITVFGCGGDRDMAKRPLMGGIAGSLCDVVVVTSDNPRTEDPVSIARQIEEGMSGTAASSHIDVDRRSAIRWALCAARAGDAVLIAGKGHEDRQVFADRTVHFDDRETARDELRALGRKPRQRC